jgi:hypothetical protein
MSATDGFSARLSPAADRVAEARELLWRILSDRLHSAKEIAAEIGVSAATVSHWRRGVQAPTDARLGQLRVIAARTPEIAPHHRDVLEQLPRTREGIFCAFVFGCHVGSLEEHRLQQEAALAALRRAAGDGGRP